MVCQFCQASLPRDRFFCPQCKQWNAASAKPFSKENDGTILLSEITDSKLKRYSTGPWDKNFGDGGVATTSVNLIAGPPGVGKSTFILQLIAVLSDTTKTEALFIGAEESDKQVKDRATRLGLHRKRIRVLPVDKQNGANIELIIANRKPCCVVIDSINSYSENPEHQVQICKGLKLWAVKLDCPFFVIARVTKGAEIAGLNDLQHEVDMTCMFYDEGDYRFVRTIKNRFGPANVETFFAMTAKGLVEIEDPEGDGESDE